MYNCLWNDGTRMRRIGLIKTDLIKGVYPNIKSVKIRSIRVIRVLFIQHLRKS